MLNIRKYYINKYYDLSNNWDISYSPWILFNNYIILFQNKIVGLLHDEEWNVT